jgi:hypothetical protein
MKYTILGEDIDLVHYLAPLGFGAEVLMTEAAVQCLREGGLEPAGLMQQSWRNLRECASRERWGKRYAEQVIYALPLDALLKQSI